MRDTVESVHSRINGRLHKDYTIYIINDLIQKPFIDLYKNGTLKLSYIFILIEIVVLCYPEQGQITQMLFIFVMKIPFV